MVTKKIMPPALTIIALVFSIILSWVLCIFIGLKLNIPSNLNQVLGDPCGRYTLDFLFGSSICLLIFIIVAFVFRYINKILLTTILVPSALLGIYIVGHAMKADDSVSSYGYLARDCRVFLGEEPPKHKSNPEIEKKWDSLQERFFGQEITEEEFEKERDLIMIEQDVWRKENQ